MANHAVPEMDRIIAQNPGNSEVASQQLIQFLGDRLQTMVDEGSINNQQAATIHYAVVKKMEERLEGSLVATAQADLPPKMVDIFTDNIELLSSRLPEGVRSEINRRIDLMRGIDTGGKGMEVLQQRKDSFLEYLNPQISRGELTHDQAIVAFRVFYFSAKKVLINESTTDVNNKVYSLRLSEKEIKAMMEQAVIARVENAFFELLEGLRNIQEGVNPRDFIETFYNRFLAELGDDFNKGELEFDQGSYASELFKGVVLRDPEIGQIVRNYNSGAREDSRSSTESETTESQGNFVSLAQNILSSIYVSQRNWASSGLDIRRNMDALQEIVANNDGEARAQLNQEVSQLRQNVYGILDQQLLPQILSEASQGRYEGLEFLLSLQESDFCDYGLRNLIQQGINSIRSLESFYQVRISISNQVGSRLRGGEWNEQLGSEIRIRLDSLRTLAASSEGTQFAGEINRLMENSRQELVQTVGLNDRSVRNMVRVGRGPEIVSFYQQIIGSSFFGPGEGVALNNQINMISNIAIQEINSLGTVLNNRIANSRIS